MSETSAQAVRVREARTEDASVIAGFNVAMARETEALALDPAAAEAGARAVFEREGLGRYFVAELEGQLAGQLMVTYEWSDWRNALFLWIQSVYVVPELRRRGVFRALYHHVEELSRTPGHCGLRLYVHSHNPEAATTYRELGMVEPGYSILETPDRLRS